MKIIAWQGSSELLPYFLAKTGCIHGKLVLCNCWAGLHCMSEQNKECVHRSISVHLGKKGMAKCNFQQSVVTLWLVGFFCHIVFANLPQGIVREVRLRGTVSALSHRRYIISHG